MKSCPVGMSILEVSEAIPCYCNNGLDDSGAAFSRPGGYISEDIAFLWPPVTDELGDYQVVTAPQHLPTPPTGRAPLPEIDDIDAADAPLRRLLALASVVGLPRQIERDQEANTVTRPQMPFQLVTQGRMSVLASRPDGSSGEQRQAPAE